MAAQRTVLAFDYGEQRVGVAVGDHALGIAHAIRVIDADDAKTRFAAIGELIAEWQPCELVVGLPSHPDGTEHEVSRLARRFANRLHGRFGLPVVLVDERYTSAAAEAQFAHSARAKSQAKSMIDAAAAQVILQSYFDDPASAAKRA